MVNEGSARNDIFSLAHLDHLQMVMEWACSAEYIELSTTEIDALSHRIEVLPSEYRAAIMGRYALQLSDVDIQKLFHIEDPEQNSSYGLYLLGLAIPLQHGQVISDTSITRACEILKQRETENKDTRQRLPSLSYRHKIRMKRILGKTTGGVILLRLVKTAAVVFIVCSLAFGSAYGVSAEFRAAVKEWYVRTFTTNSEFHSPDYTEARADNHPPDITPEMLAERNRYIFPDLPERFGEPEITITNAAYRRIFTSPYDEMLDWQVCLAVQSNYNFDTEGTTVYETVIRGQPAYYFENKGWKFVVFNVNEDITSAIQYDGYEDMEFLFDLAESIQRK